ncbi:unnamed protein product, partial [Mesorhabditis belari]|uniref:Uncharacterized protein n=1 Tax=Mesorhabditis belari TaxID=2138241 RepID=A0AAF3EVU1_9BILA
MFHIVLFKCDPASLRSQIHPRQEVIQIVFDQEREHYITICDKNDSKLCYAIKIEKRIKNRIHSKLKMEISILKMVANERKGTSERNHFTAIIDRGKKEYYYFLIMQLANRCRISRKIAL